MELVEVARALYALPPEEFTAARTARSREARAAGDRDLAAQVAALRKPSAAAWTVDRLVRTDPGRVRALLDLGRRMARAQEDLAGADLRTLGREQHRLLAEARAAVVADAAAAGRAVTDAVLGQVEQTLRAAMADAGAAAAVGTALLTTHLTSTGFEPVDVEGAVGVAGAPSLLEHDGGGDGPASPSPAEPRTADDDVVTLPGARRAGRTPPAGPTAGRSARAASPAPDEPVTLRGTRGPQAAPRSTRGAQAARRTADASPGSDDAARGAGLAARRGAEEQQREEQQREEQRREQARRDEAAAALEAATDAADRARAALEAATAAAGAEAVREAALAADVDAAAARLADLQQQHAAARVAHRRAEAARRTAARDATTAAGRVKAARERVERA